MRQARYWLLTIPADGWQRESVASLPSDLCYVRGQLERGEQTGFLHWQVLASFSRKVSLRHVKSIFGHPSHAEPSRSQAAREYVWKEDTRVDGTQFEYGEFAVRRNNRTDWETVWQRAIDGQYLDIPANIRVQNYASIRRITSDFGVARALERNIFVFIGPTGTGKSRRAWTEAGLEAYPKAPTTKFWDGYHGQQHGIFN